MPEPPTLRQVPDVELVEAVVAGRVDRAGVAAGLAVGEGGPVEPLGARDGVGLAADEHPSRAGARGPACARPRGASRAHRCGGCGGRRPCGRPPCPRAPPCVGRGRASVVGTSTIPARTRLRLALRTLSTSTSCTRVALADALLVGPRPRGRRARRRPGRCRRRDAVLLEQLAGPHARCDRHLDGWLVGHLQAYVDRRPSSPGRRRCRASGSTPGRRGGACCGAA